MSGRPLGRSNEGALLAQLANRVAALERRRPVSGHYEIKLFADDQAVAVGSPFTFGIPFNLQKAKLKYVNAYVTTASSSGLVTVQIHNKGTVATPIALDMLLVPITIDANEEDAEQAATPWQIVDLNLVGGPTYSEYGFPNSDNTVFYRQQLRIDVVTAGTGAMGLGVQLGFD